MSVHANPDLNGVHFGRVVVTIDAELGDCVLWVPTPGGSQRRIHLNSMDEIEGSLGVHAGNAKNDPLSADMVRALRFAAQRIAGREGGRR